MKVKILDVAQPVVAVAVVGAGLWFIGHRPAHPAGATVSGPQASAAAGPYTAVGNGEYLVGRGPGVLAPGVYTVTVPADSNGCVWEQKTMSGVVVTGYAAASAEVKIDVRDTAVTFKTRQCGVWTLRQ